MSKVYNKGCEADNKAKEIFDKLFDNVKRTKYNEFYDYLVSKGTLNLKIEVKYCPIPYRSGYIQFRWNQFKKLIECGDFLVYFMSDKGNIFLTPKQIIKKGHIHYNGKNKKEKTIFLRIRLNKENKLELIEAENCKFCLGTIKDCWDREKKDATHNKD